MFEDELEHLSMTPEKWNILDKSLISDEYRVVVNDYQSREWARLPICRSLFGVCRNFSMGRCTRKEHCFNKSRF